MITTFFIEELHFNNFSKEMAQYTYITATTRSLCA